MNKKISFRLSLLVVLGVVVACERGSRDFAARSGPPKGTPVYQVALHESEVRATDQVVDAFPARGGVINGEALYVKNCSVCHQTTGLGVPGAFPPLDGSSYVTGEKVDRLASIMIYGLLGPIHVNGTLYNGAMTPMGSLSDGELAAIATYIRGAWSNKAGTVEPTVFADARKKWGTRGPFQISELGEDR